MTPRPLRPALALLVVGILTVFASPASAALPGTPSVRLVSPGGHATLYRYGKRVPLFDLPVWVAADGDFKLRVSRPDYDTPVDIVQVDADTGDVLRDLPEETLDGWNGLAGFVEVTVLDSADNVVRERSFTFCPNGWDRQRVDDSGPDVPTYPTMCADWLPFFTRGMVWGIDSGWAAHAFSEGDFATPSVRLPVGEYTFVVRIADAYADLLEIAPEDTEATVSATVVDGYKCCYGREASAADRSERAVQSVGVPDVSDPDPSTVPDLVALPLWGLSTSTRKGRDYLNFGATPWNAGPAPMVIEGFRQSGETVMDAYQYFRDADGNVVGRAQVGEMAWDDRRGHHHWHFLQFAQFTLRDAAQGEVVRSRKQAFCLAPTNAIDLTVERAAYDPYESGIGTQCGYGESALWVREVLQTGWADSYYQVAGQAFNITNLPNGWYYARMDVNPLGALYETTTANNSESRLLYLGGRPGQRTVRVTPWHGVEF
jgi:Lysyl oxidase